MERFNDLMKARLNKMKSLEEEGINPFATKFEGGTLIEDIRKKYEKKLKVEEKTNDVYKVRGRIMIKREIGKIAFLNLKDFSGDIQLFFSLKDLSDKDKKIFRNLDVGDFIGVKGVVGKTKTGELSIFVQELYFLTKSIRPLPEKWHGIKDTESRLRKRYLDILLNQEVKEMFIKKSRFWNAVREFLLERGFMEVETPVLEVTTGGADARPFITHHNALDIDVYLRISMGELWQKRLMVAGFEKTFEIGRQFRNEGMDAEHLQDYTQMEFYWAYANYEDGMKLVEDLYKHVALKTFGTLKFKIRGFDIDLGKKWERYDYRETVKKYTGIDVLNTNLEEIKAKLDELGVEYDKKGFNITRAIDNLWKYCRKKIAGPGFLVGVPVAISPLAKRDDKNPEITQRFQPIIAGSELGNGYSELNDPIDQAQRFEEQQKLREQGDEEAQMYDHDFVEALEYGMPPTCGFGMSERVFSFFMDKPARECQIFPLLRPQKED